MRLECELMRKMRTCRKIAYSPSLVKAGGAVVMRPPAMRSCQEEEGAAEVEAVAEEDEDEG